MAFCQYCGAPLPSIENLRFCPNCGATLITAEAAKQIAASQIEPVPFEDIGRHGFFRALWLTWREASLSPSQFFSRARTTQEIGWPILFAIVIGTGVGIIAIAQNYAMRPVNRYLQQLLAQMMPGTSLNAEPSAVERFVESPAGQLLGLFAQPFIVVMAIFMSAAIYHLVLTLLGAGKNGFPQTVRALAYCHAALVWVIVPCGGPLISIIWWFVLAIVGLARIHQTDDWRAAVAVFLPFIICCGTCMGGVILLSLFGLALGGSS